jgi:hypothetical protein
MIWVWYWWNQPLILVTGMLVCIALFFFLVTKSSRVDQQLQHQLHILAINQAEIKSLQGQYQHGKSGNHYLSGFDDKINGMTRDLDVFGLGSLYQYIQRTQSDQGSDRLAQALVHPFSSQVILERQAAIKELSPLIDWRQNLAASQMDSPIKHETQQILQEWLRDETFQSLPTRWIIISFVLPVCTISVTLLYTLKLIPQNIFVLFVIVVFALLGYIANIASRWFKPLQRISKELNTLLPCLQLIEDQPFASNILDQCRSTIMVPSPASHSINLLSRIIARFDYRLNPIVFIPMNFFLCWDLRQVLALIQWKQKFYGNILSWFDALAELESLSSFATLSFNHPDWAFPVISDSWFTFQAKGLAHPLLVPPKVVTNDFSIDAPLQMALITGSNMAGKSTFLRSIGANMILANTGSPVHATHLTYSPGTVLTSMRISDNLQEETSTFYAELKKIKIILDAVNQKEKAIILIDEMLRGTNAEDRRIGSYGLIHQLIRNGAVGVIASHDTGLSAFKDQYPGLVQNYYFDSHLEGDQIKFDYTLKEGICTSANASFLMKKMGIEI